MATVLECPECGSRQFDKSDDGYSCNDILCTFQCSVDESWMYYVKAKPPSNIPEPKNVKPALENNPSKKNLRLECYQWIKGNPDIANLFLQFAQQLAKKGKPFGVKLIAERIRWEFAIEKTEDFKINNNYPAYVARWLVFKDPQLEPLLSFRETQY